MHSIKEPAFGNITDKVYVQQTEELYFRLKTSLAPGGTMIWATTTPVPPDDDDRDNNDVIRINQRAARLFGPGSLHPEVVVHDLYSVVAANCRSCFPETCTCG